MSEVASTEHQRDPASARLGKKDQGNEERNKGTAKGNISTETRFRFRNRRIR